MRVILAVLCLCLFSSFAEAGIFKRMKERRTGSGCSTGCSQQQSFQQQSFQQQQQTISQKSTSSGCTAAGCPAPAMPKLTLPK